MKFTSDNDICLNMQKLLEVLHEVLPRMSLIASDFSYLPDVSIPGERAPLVSTKVCSFSYNTVTSFYIVTLWYNVNAWNVKGSDVGFGIGGPIYAWL